MVKAKSGVPRGYQAVMPYLRVKDAVAAIKFYKRAFGATEAYRLKMGGKIGHAELNIGGAVIMLSDEFPEHKALGPKALKGTSVALTVYVDDVDKHVAKALKAGAKLRMKVDDQFYGDRVGQIEDPFGHVWSLHTRIAKVAPKDMQKRLNAMMREGGAAAKKSAGKRTPKRQAARAAKAPAEGAPVGRRPIASRSGARRRTSART